MPTKTQLENRTKVLRALRSGKYTQGYGMLRKVDGKKVYHCCLGVASEVCNIPFEVEGNYSTFNFPNFGEDSALLPDVDAAEMFGITMEQADHFTTRAVEMNDNESRDFLYIARRMSKFFKMCDAWNKENPVK